MCADYLAAKLEIERLRTEIVRLEMLHRKEDGNIQLGSESKMQSELPCISLPCSITKGDHEEVNSFFGGRWGTNKGSLLGYTVNVGTSYTHGYLYIYKK